jgi:hypothetical protein
MTEVQRDLFNKRIDELTPDEGRSVVEIYKLLVDMADKVSQRRQNANNFYLSVNSGIIGASAYISAIDHGAINIIVISVAGLLVSALWKRNIDSYKDLNSSKFHVITELEKALPLSAFAVEWDVLERGENKSRYRPFHTVEVLVPFIFIGVHCAQIIRVVPWAKFLSALTY